METKHTPTPWIVKDTNMMGTYIYSEHYNLLLASMSQTRADNECIANAKRIVECVNALKEIDNPTKFINDLELLNDLKGDEFAQAIRSVNFCKKYNELKEVIEDMIKHLDEGRVLTLRKDSIIVEALRNTINKK